MSQATASEISALFDMTPKAALAWLVKKGLRIRTDPENMSDDDHVMSFGFANLSRLDIAQDIVDGLKTALAEGKTQKQFIDDLEPILKKKGWWGTKEEIDTDTGEIKTIKMGSPARLATIYRTNIQSAYNAGRYQSMLANAENRPYWRYVAIMDQNTRPSHAALHNMVFRFDDPIWLVLFPPNGYNCRCRVEALTEEDVQTRGYTIYKTDRIVTQEITAPTDANGEKRKTKVHGVEFSPDAEKNGNKPGTKPDDKPGDKPGTKPDDKPGDKPGTKPDDKAGDKPGTKPDDKAGDKPGTKPDDKAGDKPGTKPEDKTGEKTGEKPHVFYPDAGFDSNPALTVYQTNPDAYSVELARPYTQAGLKGPQMSQLYNAEGTGEVLPVAVLDLASQSLYEFAARTVWFTEPAITAQRLAGTLPALVDMPAAQLVIESPSLVVRGDNDTLEMFREVDGRWLRVIISAVMLGVISYMVVSRSDVEEVENNGDIIG
ncbi:phage minor head protein [Serratia fonticola]|uniref:phage head morphogenesis protein n=1 Tax=Serratia fonticola TaxID=47917 RepID=UPI0027F2ADCB|nr:phage minor head protein [Serratia fonticola]MDQ7212544.1 phage minor head protein [Serratia fonticola]HBE9082723.1 minor capsid protein [Serratia fonticola]HBE9093276.1 minor capsid protein [Serratia fonticola]HBE9155573.1 minor capsid protein [Serratia fonticola]